MDPNEIKELAIYMHGMGDGTGNERLKKAARWLEKLASHICGQGYIGCYGGRECSSDHK